MTHSLCVRIGDSCAVQYLTPMAIDDSLVLSLCTITGAVSVLFYGFNTVLTLDVCFNGTVSDSCVAILLIK